MSSVIIAGDTSGTVTLQAPSAAGSTVINLPAVNGTAVVNSNATNVLAEAQGGTGTTTGYYGFKNRIINGAMVIDQRNAGASVTITNTGNFTYTLDRWAAYGNVASKFSVQQNAGSVTPPVGFSNYLGVTSLAVTSLGAGDNYSVRQFIEGFNFADMAWGTANAKAITLSFQVYSSLTGTFGGSLMNSAYNRAYPFTYTISAANTWTTVSVTIAGDTSGTWVGATNGIGVQVIFGLGVGSTYSGTAGAWAGSQYISATGATSVVGTNGATFYITGVQLEKGSTATSFDYRPYGTELALCQRYLPAWNWQSGNDCFGTGYSVSTVQSLIQFAFGTPPRVCPTGVSASGLANMVLRNGVNSGGVPTAIAFNVGGSSTSGASFSVTTAAGSPTLVAGQGAFIFANGTAQLLFTGCEL